MPVLDEQNVELVDIELKGSVGSLLLRIYVDTDEGISLSQCSAISRNVSDLLDIHDEIPGKYRLDVSSPGVDRPLRKIRDFQRNIDRDVLIVRDEGVDIIGKIISANDNIVVVKTNQDEMSIPFETIQYGKIRLKW
ncbi:ribosome maturation factor RimP [candidate division KSB1 bacterium]|nr:ribosome maturation factor RimP [candidate division KSB1 bacterium]